MDVGAPFAVDVVRRHLLDAMFAKFLLGEGESGFDIGDPITRGYPYYGTPHTGYAEISHIEVGCLNDSAGGFGANVASGGNQHRCRRIMPGESHLAKRTAGGPMSTDAPRKVIRSVGALGAAAPRRRLALSISQRPGVPPAECRNPPEAIAVGGRRIPAGGARRRRVSRRSAVSVREEGGGGERGRAKRAGGIFAVVCAERGNGEILTAGEMLNAERDEYRERV